MVGVGVVGVGVVGVEVVGVGAGGATTVYLMWAALLCPSELTAVTV